MRVLIAVAPIISHRIAPAERAYTLAQTLKNRGHEVQVSGVSSDKWDTTFAPKFEKLGVHVYTSKAPKPHLVSETRRMYVLPFTRKARNPQVLNEERNIEETFNNAGILDKEWFSDQFDFICKQIQEFHPDLVYSEYNIAAIPAAKFCHVPVCCTENYYAIPGYSAGSIRSREVADILEEHKLPRIQECSDLFEWCEKRFVPSVIELDPFKPEDVTFVGTFHKPTAYTHSVDPRERPVVLFSTVNKTVTDRHVIREANKAFKDKYEVYITGLKPESIEQYGSKIGSHIHLSSIDDVDKTIEEIMPKAQAFINCGQLDQVLIAMASKVPQCICPGDIFERKYLAYSLRMAHAAMYIGIEAFVAYGLNSIYQRLTEDPDYAQNARQIVRKMMNAGGSVKIAKEMEQMVRSGVTSQPAPSLDPPKKPKDKGGNAPAEGSAVDRSPLLNVFRPRTRNASQS